MGKVLKQKEMFLFIAQINTDMIISTIYMIHIRIRYKI